MKKDKVFYQSKFEHYRVMNMWIVIASCISSLFYVISDWYLFGEINMVTVPARTALLIPFAIYDRECKGEGLPRDRAVILSDRT